MPDRPIKKYSTEVFLLFPECNDANRVMSAPYIKGYDFDFEECIPTGVSEIMEVIAFFAYERINYYYDSRNLDGLYYPNLICDDYPFVDTIVRASFGQFGIEDWRTYFGEDGTEIMWNGNQSINDTCAKVYERNNISNEFDEVHATLLSSEEAIVMVNKSVSISNQIGDVQMLPVKTSILDMYSWWCVKRLPQRRFDVDEKHGENGVGGRRIPNKGYASLLLCHRTRAQQLLDKAVGNGKESDLWYYDEDKKKYIYFENQYEESQPAYHGYHISPEDGGFEKIDINRLKLFQNNIPD